MFGAPSTISLLPFHAGIVPKFEIPWKRLELKGPPVLVVA